MDYNVALAQKYRPITFSDVLDQEPIIKVLKNVVKQRKYFSPFMFSGDFGGGKTTLARIFARAILCKNLTLDGEPCNTCESCISFLENKHVAYTEIDAASNSGVDSIRKLREDAQLKVLGNYETKVVVIDECHSISKQGNEALLKQLEESTSNQIYILCTTSPESMLETVRSRCFELSLKKNTKESISKRIQYICEKESIKYQKEAVAIISAICSPHVRDAIKSLDFLSNYGEISLSSVQEYFNLDTDADVLSLIKFLKTDLNESLSLLQKILSKRNVLSTYEGLIENFIKISKIQYGINDFKNKDQYLMAQEISAHYTTGISEILEELLKRNRYSDALTLEADIILIHQKLNYGFNKVMVAVQPQEYIEKKEIKEATTQEIQEISKESTIEESSEKTLDAIEETSKVLKRYKSYPDQLAMMMDKSKKSCSLKLNTSVELNKEIKDFKQNLSKQEIKNFLESKRH